jgi:hypothetical protein
MTKQREYPWTRSCLRVNFLDFPAFVGVSVQDIDNVCNYLLLFTVKLVH